ncbi:MAG TPA: hypothetical protein ENO30_02920, partial [Thermodesulfobium narugense]|nr:hypothetical protein [Thermodesulfobium narugense]
MIQDYKKILRNKKLGDSRICLLIYVMRELPSRKKNKKELESLIKLLLKLKKSEIILLKEAITLKMITEGEWEKERLKNTIRKIIEYNLPEKAHIKQVKRL